MEIQGKLITKLSEQSGTSGKGDWKKQDAVIETLEQYPKKVCITFWSDKVDELKKISDGQVLKVFFDIESREYQGKWYTNLKAWKFELAESNNSQSNNSEPPAQPSSDEFEDLNNSESNIDDLPF